MSSPSPTSPGLGGSPEPLTPRSKIKALLATVDSSDDDATPTRKPAKKASKPISDTAHIDLPQLPSDDSESEEDVRPRGRLAARMQGIPQATEPTQPSNPAETARDRVKKMLEREEEEAQKTHDIIMEDAEDEDSLPVAPRRLKRKLAQAPAPESTTSARSPSPALFVSSPARPSPAKSTHNASDSENDLPTLKSDRFKALVERKRQERLAREAADEARNAEKRAEQEKLASELEQLASDDSGVTDDEGGRKLTQEARPAARKASRKAIEDMNRETQRMARNMQLAHQAKTRKKITKNSLFERFNFRPAGEAEPKTASSSRPASPPTDVEMREGQTPPSSPPTNKNSEAMEKVVEEADGLTLDDATTPKQSLDKGKGKAIEPVEEQRKASPKAKRQVRIKLPIISANLAMPNSDDELEITVTTKDKVKAVFDNAPTNRAQESHSFKALRALAQVRSPGKERRRRNETPSMTAGGLQTLLQQRARQQAKLERDSRLEMLKAQGIVVQTAEERERQMQEVEDIVAKAREEAQKIMELEREEAKKEKKENGEVDPLAWDDSDDEEYQASGDDADDADTEEAALELSGSEEEGEDEDDEEEASDNPMFDDAAEDAEAGEDEEKEKTPVTGQEIDDDDQELPVLNKRRARKQTAIISDDEDDVETTPKPKSGYKSPTIPGTQSPAAPTSVLRSAKKTFIPGLPVKGPAGLGLTQIFAGTMDDSQMGPASGPTQSMMPDFDNFPDSNFSATMDEPEDMVLDSQAGETQKATQAVQLNFSQSQMRGLDSLLREQSSTQFSEMIELSQDGGFLEHTPIKDRFVEPPISTVETVMVDENAAAAQGSPLVRRGRLRRRMETQTIVEETPEPTAEEKSETAFNALQQGAKMEKKRRIQDEFNKKKSKAKEMVQEQAEESEDEYAGLGGADGEDSDNESIASVKEMIDDAAGNDADEAKLAAFYADRERAEDEKQVEKLFKDITTGMLRRKRGADYDLSDSDDDGEARRKMKRRQFAKMQKALFSDERVKKIAEKPGNQAFLRTIEDRGSDDEMDFLDIVEQPEEESQESQSQDESGKPQTIPDSQPNKAVAGARPAAHLRRTKDGKKPSNIGEVRETLSNLLDDPHSSVIPATEAGSDSEGEDGASARRNDKEDQEAGSRRGSVAVVDRISLKRNNSSASGSSTRLAFAAASSSSFKVPALLRRATTNSLVSGSSASTSSTGVSTPMSGSGFGEDAKIKKNASKKSGINAFARDSERRARLEQTERRREERKIKGAEKRLGVVGGILGKGTFE